LLTSADHDHGAGIHAVLLNFKPDHLVAICSENGARFMDTILKVLFAVMADS